MGIWIILFGIMGLIIFIAWELKVESPILDIRLLTRNKLFVFSNLTQLIFYSAIFTIPLILSLYLQYIKGLSPQDTGFVLLSQPAIQAIFSPIAGRISDKIQPRTIVSASLVIALVGLLLLLSATESTPLLLFIISLVLFGFSFAFVASPNTNAIMSSVEKKDLGVASAIESTSRNVGVTFGIGILMLLFSLYMGTAQITPEHYSAFMGSIRMAFVVSSGLCICCIVISLARGKVAIRP
jgi:predicted MFS family arabinose efflux permease